MQYKDKGKVLMYHVIMAGEQEIDFGHEEKGVPKQLLKLIGNDTLIRQTVDHIKEIDSADKIFIVASANLCKQIKKKFQKSHYLILLKSPLGEKYSSRNWLSRFVYLQKIRMQ